MKRGTHTFDEQLCVCRWRRNFIVDQTRRAASVKLEIGENQAAFVLFSAADFNVVRSLKKFDIIVLNANYQCFVRWELISIYSCIRKYWPRTKYATKKLFYILYRGNRDESIIIQLINKL